MVNMIIIYLKYIVYVKLKHSKCSLNVSDCVLSVLELHRAFNIKVDRVGKVKIDSHIVIVGVVRF